MSSQETRLHRSDSVYVAGHRGLIGSAVLRRLAQEGFTNVLTRDRAEVDLTQEAPVRRFFDEQRPEVVILAAGRVGGILENLRHPADFITENLAIQLNVFRSALAVGCERVVFFGSSCMFPKHCPQPMREDMVFEGKPEPTSLPYAVAKIAGVEMCLALNRQLEQTRFIPVIPNSAFGPNDDFGLESSHVLSALMRRFHDAREAGAEKVVLWGSGNPRREFVHADDIADAVLFLLNADLADVELPINIGAGVDYSIRELAETMASVVGYQGGIEWDTSKPDGSPRKLLDSSRIRALGWQPHTDFRHGLEQTYEWFLANIREVAL